MDFMSVRGIPICRRYVKAANTPIRTRVSLVIRKPAVGAPFGCSNKEPRPRLPPLLLLLLPKLFTVLEHNCAKCRSSRDVDSNSRGGEVSRREGHFLFFWKEKKSFRTGAVFLLPGNASDPAKPNSGAGCRCFVGHPRHKRAWNRWYLLRIYCGLPVNPAYLNRL